MRRARLNESHLRPLAPLTMKKLLVVPLAIGVMFMVFPSQTGYAAGYLVGTIERAFAGTSN